MEDELDAILPQLNFDDLSFLDAPFEFDLLNVYGTDSASSANNSSRSSTNAAALSTHARSDFSASSTRAPLPPSNQPHPTTTARFGELKTDGGSQKESCS